MVDAKLIISSFAGAIEKQGRTFGPVFPKLVGKAMVEFVANKVSEASPEMDSLSEAVQYVTRNLSKYPRGYTTLIYSVGKALIALEGTAGIGFKMLSRSMFKQIFSKVGLEQIVGHISGTAEALGKCIKFIETSNVMEKGVLSCSGDETMAKLNVSGCDYEDICRKINEED